MSALDLAALANDLDALERMANYATVTQANQRVLRDVLAAARHLLAHPPLNSPTVREMARAYVNGAAAREALWLKYAQWLAGNAWAPADDADPAHDPEVGKRLRAALGLDDDNRPLRGEGGGE